MGGFRALQSYYGLWGRREEPLQSNEELLPAQPTTVAAIIIPSNLACTRVAGECPVTYTRLSCSSRLQLVDRQLRRLDISF